MAFVFANVGCQGNLKARFNNVWPAGGKDFTLKLGATNTTPAATDTASTYTEATGGGYAAKTLTNGSFTVSITNNIAQAAYAAQTFTFTGALTTNPTIYTYFVVDADGVLVGGESLPAPFTPATNGDNYVNTLVLQQSHGTPTT